MESRTYGEGLGRTGRLAAPRWYVSCKASRFGRTYEFCLDSVSENHFFSISCLLYPHVHATPNYSTDGNFDRAWPQNLYLSPTSPLLTRTHGRLVLPPHFNISGTPLVTFRRNDVLFSAAELEDLWKRAPSYDPGRKLLSDDQAWFIGTDEYLSWFTTSRAAGGAGYSTLIVSTGGHWTTGLFGAFREDQSAEEGAGPAPGAGIHGVLEFFQTAMTNWAERMQAAVAKTAAEETVAAARSRTGGTKRQVIVRAYLPGHEDCHTHRQPWLEIQEWKNRPYNWGEIEDFNRIFDVRHRTVMATQSTDVLFRRLLRNCQMCTI